MKKFNCIKFIFILSICTFFLSAFVCMFGRFLCYRDTQNYTELQKELTAPNIIETVLVNEDNEQIYVCYKDTPYVNVYEQNGDFLWAVSTPKSRSAYFYLDNTFLNIATDDGTYIYDSKNGKFINKNIDLTYYETELEYSDKKRVGNIHYNAMNVFTLDAEGNKTYIVKKPWFHWIFYPIACIATMFISAASIFVTFYIVSKGDYKKIDKLSVLSTKRSKFIFHYARITAGVQLTFSIINTATLGLDGYVAMVFFPLIIHFIISGIVLHNLFDSLKTANEEETTVLFHCILVNWGTAALMLVSLLICAIMLP